MEMRVYGRTGMQISVLGFGCGAVGGLMTNGDPADQERFPIETAAGELPILQSILSVAPACVSSGRD